MGRARVVVPALGLMMCVSGNAVAHFTFVMPQKFRVSKGGTLIIGFHNADGFPESEQVLKRLQDATMHLPLARLPIRVNEDRPRKRVAGSVTVPVSGHLIVTGVTASATMDMKADEFLEYLKEEGLTHVIESRAQRGEAGQPTRERYTMYAKSILVADTPNDGHGKVVGLPLEMVPEKDPYRLKSGESLPVRVLLRRSPAPNLEVKAVTAGAGSKERTVGRTDADGLISVPLTSGIWRLHTVYMERSAKADAEWESFWSTLTFEIP